MNELIKVDPNGRLTARELYEFLSPDDKSHYSRWAKTNIEQNEFYQEGTDWQGFAIMANGNVTKDYSLTIDFAKHLCMLSRSERGKQARNYFLEVEKRLSNITQPACLEDVLIAQLQQMKEVRQQVEQHGKAIAETQEQVRQIAAAVKTSPIEYYTVAGYCGLRGIKIDVSKAALLGRKASKLSHKYDVTIGKTHDPRFGQVNTYHIDILKEVFSEN